ncbi:MAG: C39 family peptidase [Thermodesulfovibrionales bacterium]
MRFIEFIKFLLQSLACSLQRFCLLLLCLIIACSSHLIIQYGPEVIINSVPFYPQEDYQCGPSSLAGVMNYYGFNLTPQEIASEIYSKSARGTLDLDLLFYAEKKGLEAEKYNGSINDLKEKVKAGYPLIVLVDYGYGPIQVNHFMVIIGYNESGVFANSGREEKKFITYKEFLRVWDRTGNWTLLIRGDRKGAVEKRI